MKKTYILILMLVSALTAFAAPGPDHLNLNLGGNAAGEAAGAVIPLEVYACNSADIPIFGYSGSVSLTASVGRVVPGTISFVNGVWSGNVLLLGAADPVTLTATDITYTSATGIAERKITAGPYTKLLFIAKGMTYAPGTTGVGYTGTPAAQVIAVPFSVTAYACDTYYNQVEDTSSLPEIEFSCNPGDTLIVSPGSVTLSAAASASAVFELSFNPSTNLTGSYPITLWETHNNAVFRTSPYILFNSNNDYYIWADAPAEVTAGQDFTATVTVSHEQPRNGEPIIGLEDYVSIKGIDSATGLELSQPLTRTADHDTADGVASFTVRCDKRGMINLAASDGDHEALNKDLPSRYSYNIQVFSAEPVTYTASISKTKLFRDEKAELSVALFDTYGNPVSNTAVNYVVYGTGYLDTPGTKFKQVATSYAGVSTANFASADFTVTNICATVILEGLAKTVTFTAEVARILDKKKIGNFPNPFIAGKESTRIDYYLESASDIEFALYTVSGSKVWTKNISSSEAGGRPGYNQYIWDGTTDRGMMVPAGVYILKVNISGNAGKYTLTRKIAVRK